MGNWEEKTEPNQEQKKLDKCSNIFDGNIVEKRFTPPPNGGTYNPEYEIGVRVSLDDSVKTNKNSKEFKRMYFYESFADEGFFTPYIIHLKTLLYTDDPQLAQELFDVSMAFRYGFNAPPNRMEYVRCADGAGQGHFFTWASFLFDKGAVFREEYYSYIFNLESNSDFGDIRSQLNIIGLILSWGFDICTIMDNSNSITCFFRDRGIKMANKRLKTKYFNNFLNDFMIKEKYLSEQKVKFDIIDYLDQEEKELVKKVDFYKNKLEEFKKEKDKKNIEKYRTLLIKAQSKTYNPNFSEATQTYSLPPEKVLDIIEHHFFLRLCKQLLKFKQKRPLDRKFLTLINRYKLTDVAIIEELYQRSDGKIVPFDWNTDFDNVEFW